MEQSEQRRTILKAMLNHPEKEKWFATDFQNLNSEYFVGYEASPRMSEIAQKYSDVIIVGKEKRFRWLALDFSLTKEIQQLYNLVNID